MHLLSFEECDVEDRRVKVHKLEHENLEGQIIFVLGLSSVHFWNRKKRQWSEVNNQW